MILALSLGTLVLSLSILVAAICALHKKETVSHKDAKVVKHRTSRPKLSPAPHISDEAKEKEVDHLLKKKNLSLVEMQYIYDFLMDTGKEKWRYIKGYEGVYRISSTGIVENCRFGRILSPVQQKGKFIVHICADGKKKGVSIHKVVAETFIPNPSGDLSVRPKDGNYLHCDVRNLKWLPRTASYKTAAEKKKAA